MQIGDSGEIGLVIHLVLLGAYRLPRVFGDKFCDKFSDEFGDSLILVKNSVTHWVTDLVNHLIW